MILLRGGARGVASSHLCVRVYVPEVQFSLSVSAGEDSWVNRAPLNIIHILRVVVE